MKRYTIRFKIGRKIIRLGTVQANPVLMASLLNEMDACRKCWDGSRVWPGLNVVMRLYKASLEKDSLLSLIS